jgi:hypothetical protein
MATYIRLLRFSDQAMKDLKQIATGLPQLKRPTATPAQN